ncbi:MAG: bleomycin resistance protein [Gammaproteobacteria bacterium]|nr:MAG: bleomycin resistance protein [Gammaproteobacteria bacterium]
MAAAPHHVDLTVTDLETSVDFYHQVLTELGFERVPVNPGDAPCWEIRDDPVFGIALHRARSAARHDRYAAGLHHLAFRARSKAQVDRFFRFLTARGIEILDAPAEYQYTPGYYAVFFADPDGLKLELVYEPA